MILFRENVIDDKLFMTIEYLLPSLDSYFQVIFFDLRLINCIRSSNIVLGKKCASEALKISNRVNIKNIDSTIKYHLSQLVVFIEPQNSLDILSKTKNDFSEANNYPRLIYCDNLIAVALTNLGRFEEADKILKNIIAIHNNFTDNQIIESARNNIIWNYIQAQHFSLAIDAIGDYKQSVFSYYLPYCYFSLGNYRECKKSIDMIHSFNKIDSDNLSIINLIEQSVYERNKTFDKEIKKLIKRFNKKNVALLKIVLQIGIFHYEKTKNINSLAKMQKDLLTVFNNQSLL